MVFETEIINTLDDTYIDWGLKAINAPLVWNKTRGENTTITVIDTGIDSNHPDLKNKIASKFNMIDKNYDVTDLYGHGTCVAGLLVGERTGVAPMANLHVVKVLNENGLGSLANIMEGITHAMNLKSDVLCISLGTKFDIPLILKQRIINAYEAGLTIVCAVGNNGAELPHYPARMEETIGVGGLDKSLEITQFTNGGYDILAPSVKLLSTYKDSNYCKKSGTSLASPLVAGAIALLISYYRKQGKNLRPAEIKNMLKGSKLDLSKLIEA